MIRNKYGAVKTKADGYTFDSKAEAQRYGELKLLENAGEIHGLDRQVEYGLCVPAPGVLSTWSGEPAQILIGVYRCDFRYCTCDAPKRCKASNIVVEDVKGFDTPLSKWKRKHCEAQYNLRIQVIR